MRAQLFPLSKWCLVVLFHMTGCASHTEPNPSFSLTVKQARADLKQMAQQPVTLERPVIVLGGYGDPGIIADILAGELRKATGDDRIEGISFPFHTKFDQCRATLLEKIQKRFPGNDPRQTIEVDVVAVSMGSLVARYAAMPGAEDEDRVRLRVVRLFTIGGPHRGAEMASVPTLDQLIIDMRPGSQFLATLDEQLPAAGYTLYPYARLDDTIVGEQNAAPPGQRVWWVPNTPLAEGHLSASGDARIIADIARRLRGETPYTTEPRAPLPVDE